MTADTIQFILSKSNRESTCQYGWVAWCARLLPSFRWYSLTDPEWIEFLCRKSSTVPHSHGVHYILTRSPAVARIANRTRPSVLPYSRLSRVISNCCQIAYPAVFAILARRVLRSRVWPFRVTWRHRSRDHWIPHRPFPIGGPLQPITVSESVTQWFAWP